MTPARKQRLKEARKWWKEQGFTDDSHFLSAYRRQFNVDKVCAMRELVLMGVLSPEKQKEYKEQLAARDRKNAEKRARRDAKKSAGEIAYEPWQEENFFFIAGYTSGGAPYGITWEEEAEIEADTPDTVDFELPFD